MKKLAIIYRHALHIKDGAKKSLTTEIVGDVSN